MLEKKRSSLSIDRLISSPEAIALPETVTVTKDEYIRLLKEKISLLEDIVMLQQEELRFLRGQEG